eukprot:7357052-Prymnesium_polylepis.1
MASADARSSGVSLSAASSAARTSASLASSSGVICARVCATAFAASSATCFDAEQPPPRNLRAEEH